jgi:hypothetical protein
MAQEDCKECAWILVGLAVIFLIIGIPTFAIGYPQMKNVQTYNCTLLSKQEEITPTSCGNNELYSYVLTYMVRLESDHAANQVLSVCSSKHCDGTKRGARACNPLLSNDLQAYNTMVVNQTYTCFYYPQRGNVFLEDPRAQVWGIYICGIVFLSLAGFLLLILFLWGLYKW